MSTTPLSREDIDKALQSLTQWRFEDDSLKRKVQCKDFRDAVALIVRMSFVAEQLDHHPELFNVYNNIDLTLRTHDAGNKVTEKDITFAKMFEEIVG